MLKGPMFGDVIEPSVKIGTNQWYTIPLSVLGHLIAILVATVVPLIVMDVLPTPPSIIARFVIVKAVTPPPLISDRRRTEVRPAKTNFSPPPTEEPDGFNHKPPVMEPPPFSNIPLEGIAGGSFLDGVAEPPPPLPPATTPKVVPIGGDVRPPLRVRFVPPRYPVIAQSARVHGVVILQATIGTDGSVEDLRILRSIPLLDAAALEAVRQWQYNPTLLNGTPVAVSMTVTVQFALN